MESEQNTEHPFIHSGWQCGPLIIEYTGRKNERFRAEFNFVGRWDGGPPQPAELEKPLTVLKVRLVTDDLPTFDTLVHEGMMKARTE
ncbi:MAG: hypothetical protein GX652_05450 [Burkholderiaceae bacterium]|nr:hypothetical protein [Burkholderiaceae bacterium]